MEKEEVISHTVTVKIEPGIEVTTFEERNDNNKFVCCECNKSFTHNAGLFNHKKKYHKNLVPSETANIRCLEEGCNFVCNFKERLQHHLSIKHGIKMSYLDMEFDTFADFESWKEIYEKETKCRFVKKSGSRLCVEGERATYLYCSRSGKLISKKLAKKRHRISAKISNHCTASIKYLQTDEGKVKVKLCGTHYGHKKEIGLLRMTKSDKLNIAGKLQQGHTADIILDSIRASAGSNIDRIHLINRKDIKNIEKAHGIQSPDIKPVLNKKFNMDFWVSEISSKLEESPVLFYKGGSELHEKLNDNDICLILMTKGQADTLKQFGENGAFYGTCMYIKSCYDLYLVTLSLVNDINRGVPISFMITSRVDVRTYTLFCEVLKDKVADLSARALLTDGDNLLYEAWINVFDSKPCFLWSHHFVDQDWRDKLGWVEDENIQDSIYDKLYIYLSSTDSEKLCDYEEFVDSLVKNPATQEFGNYFKRNYMGKENLWAGCYKKRELGIYTSLNLDSIYHDLDKVCSFVSKYARRFDSVLRNLLKLITDQQHYRTTMINQLPNEILTRHFEVTQKPEVVEQVDETTWKVSLTKDSAIVKKKPNKCGKNCPFYCACCEACSHEFECSCSVYLFIYTMWCKHIHSVGIVLHKERLPVTQMKVETSDKCKLEKMSVDSEKPESKEVTVKLDPYKTNKKHVQLYKKDPPQDPSILKSMITNLVKEMLNETSDSRALLNLLSYLKTIQQTMRGKRKRGRPSKKSLAVEKSLKPVRVYKRKRKLDVTSSDKSDILQPVVKRKRGRPRKVLVNEPVNVDLKTMSTENSVMNSNKPEEKISHEETEKQLQENCGKKVEEDCEKKVEKDCEMKIKESCEKQRTEEGRKTEKSAVEDNSTQEQSQNSELRRSGRQRRCSRYIEDEKENTY